MVATATNPLRVGLRQERVIAPQCLVIFGASGDLTHRKLVPALFELFKQRRLPSEFALLGCARRPWSDEEFRGKMAEALASKIAENQEAWDQFIYAMAEYEEGATKAEAEQVHGLPLKEELKEKKRLPRRHFGGGDAEYESYGEPMDPVYGTWW